jgi:hypothetical protein
MFLLVQLHLRQEDISNNKTLSRFALPDVRPQLNICMWIQLHMCPAVTTRSVTSWTVNVSPAVQLCPSKRDADSPSSIGVLLLFKMYQITSFSFKVVHTLWSRWAVP